MSMLCVRHKISIKFIVGASLSISMVGMAAVLLIGFVQMRKLDSSTVVSESFTMADSVGVAPVLTLSIDKSVIPPGSSATISWSINSDAAPAPSCSSSWSGDIATNGTDSVSPGPGTYSYSVACSSLAGASVKSVDLSVSSDSAVPVSTSQTPSCGSGGSCSTSEVAAHKSASDCWSIINGNVYAITSTFLGSTHRSSLGGPSLSASKVCGKDISRIYNSKHSNGSRSGGGHTANWWLTGNGNSLVGPWSGN